jgi:hypothetical protein
MMRDGIFYTVGDTGCNEVMLQWVDLFCKSYKVGSKIAISVFQKYRINDPRFCALINNGRMVACYSGLNLKFRGKSIFVSTDTMSDGSVAFATVILAKYLYGKLIEDGVIAVCGYPNENIRVIRQRALGWVIVGQLDCYIGVPFLWKHGLNDCSSDIWIVKRPASGFFTWGTKVVVPLCRSQEYSSSYALRIALSAFRPGRFFIRVPSIFVKPKQFGYKMLSYDPRDEDAIRSCLPRLDMDTIDVP